MPLTIDVGLSRKASKDYQSTGTSINLTAELDQALLPRPRGWATPPPATGPCSSTAAATIHSRRWPPPACRWASWTIPGSTAPSMSTPPGDLAVITTDGFFESSDPGGELFGIERVMDCVRQHRDEPAADIIAQLHQAVKTFTHNAPQDDDLTGIVLRHL